MEEGRGFPLIWLYGYIGKAVMSEAGYDREFLRKIANYLFELLIFFDDDGTVRHANEVVLSTLMYQDLDELDNISDVFPTLFYKEGDKMMCREDMDGHVVSTVAYRSNNTCFEVEARFIKDLIKVDGAPDKTRHACVVEDISARERLSREISKARESSEDFVKTRDEFVANVTHELRTPVNGILGNIQELMGAERDNNKLYTMEMIEKSCNDMNALINNILDFSKLQAGKFQMEDREFSLKSMIDYVRSNHINKIHEKGLDFFVTVAPDIPDKLIGDELRLEQILNNLLSNAIKFTTVGKIMLEVVETARVGNRVELFFMVMDTGIGIADHDMDKLFKGFSQVDASISRKYGGTGLGLNISKQLVNLMGGDISVDSTAGKGSTFTFSVWLNLPDGADTAAEEYHKATPVFSSMASESGDADAGMEYGSAENREEIDKRLMKLVLCIEMDTWEKAEMFADAVKQLTLSAPKEITQTALKLKMAIQKENREKATQAIDTLKKLLNS